MSGTSFSRNTRFECRKESRSGRRAGFAKGYGGEGKRFTFGEILFAVRGIERKIKSKGVK